MRATLNSRRPDPTRAAAANRTVQRWRGSNSAQANLRSAGLSSTPRVVAQTKQLEAAFGPAIQRKTGPEDEELLQGKFPTMQRRVAPEEEELQIKAAVPTAQRQGPEEEELIQGKFAPTTAQLEAGPEREANRTGLPDDLKSGIEALSGLDMSDVRVHRNSSEPSQLGALAYAQGSTIHLAPGQERHLPHEAWHVVQQRQGRVKATAQAQGIPINDERGLEEEADVMGARALQAKMAPRGTNGATRNGVDSRSVVQRAWDASKCPEGIPAGVTPSDVLGAILTTHPLFTQGAANKGRGNWDYTYYMGLRAKVKGWWISLVAHAHGYANTGNIVPGNMYIPGYEGWSQPTGSLLAWFPRRYSAATYPDGWVDNAGNRDAFFSGVSRYPHQ